jgi:hypothetical protein
LANLGIHPPVISNPPAPRRRFQQARRGDPAARVRAPASSQWGGSLPRVLPTAA